MRILVVLLNFGASQLKYLEQVLNEYKSMEYSLDIIIHSNIPLAYKNIEVKVFQFKDDRQLQFTTRQTIYDNKDNYDLFIFSENDLLISKKNIEAFLKVTKILPKKYIAGFFQYEKYEEGLIYPAYHKHYKWDKKSVFKIEDYVFAHFTNIHQGCYILTKEQLDKIIKNFDFIKNDISKYIKEINFTNLPNRKKLKLISEDKRKSKNKFLISIVIILILIIPNIFLKKIKFILHKLLEQFPIKRLKNLNEFLNQDQYGIFEVAGAEIYLKGGLKKVIPISLFDDFLIYHLPNKYKGKLGKFDNIMRKDIENLMKRVK